MTTPSDHKVMPDDQTVWALADVLAYHRRLNPPGGKCSCGHEVRLGARFTEHQVRILLESEAGQRVLAERDALRATVASVKALTDLTFGGYQPYAIDIGDDVHLAVLLDDLRAALCESDG